MSCTIRVITVDRLPGKVVGRIVSEYPIEQRRRWLGPVEAETDEWKEFRSSKTHKKENIVNRVHYL